MNPLHRDNLRHCPICERWFAPAHRGQWVCWNCSSSGTSRVIGWLWVCFAASVIAILFWLLKK